MVMEVLMRCVNISKGVLVEGVRCREEGKD